MLAGRLLLTAARGRGGNQSECWAEPMTSEDEVTRCHTLSHNVPAKAVSGSLTVPVAGEAVNLVQSGVGFAHGVQLGMSEGALLSPRGWTSGKKKRV